MLIRRGKDEGWLQLDPAAVKQWATASGIDFTSASPKIIPGRGMGLVADRDMRSRHDGQACQILQISQDLVLSGEAVKNQAQFDKDFREVLESIGDFGRTPRGAILSFLLFQASVSCPFLSDKIGVHVPFTEYVLVARLIPGNGVQSDELTYPRYVKSLPCEMLPTFWSNEELQLLVGTTLAPAVSSKLKSLQREYDLLCSSAANTRWFKAVAPYLDLDDWLHVDAMFRSRALDFYGSCMIPGMDLASHAGGERTNAYYDKGNDSYHLWLIRGKELIEGQEVTITYGDEKGACEMLFSYGFIEEEMDTAETLFLSLGIPDSDPYRPAKMKIADCAPGFKLIDVPEDENLSPHTGHLEAEQPSGGIDWDGDFVWLLCVDHEDGLRFELARTVDGQDEELQATFNGQELKHGAAHLRQILARCDNWPVFRLRAVVILQQRIFEQMQVLYESREQIESTFHGDGTPVREAPYQQALKLRRLEFELLEKAYEDFERQKVELAESHVVQRYLASMNAPDEGLAEEDFS